MLGQSIELYILSQYIYSSMGQSGWGSQVGAVRLGQSGWGSQVGAVRLGQWFHPHVFHLCGPRFEPGPSHHSLKPDCMGFHSRGFPPTSKSKKSALTSTQQFGVVFPFGCFADYHII